MYEKGILFILHGRADDLPLTFFTDELSQHRYSILARLFAHNTADGGALFYQSIDPPFRSFTTIVSLTAVDHTRYSRHPWPPMQALPPISFYTNTGIQLKVYHLLCTSPAWIPHFPPPVQAR
jgi:uncharacterized protein YqiB (DUF1249 family)